MTEPKGKPPRAGAFDPWPREEWPAPEGTAIFRDCEEIPARAPQRDRVSS